MNATQSAPALRANSAPAAPIGDLALIETMLAGVPAGQRAQAERLLDAGLPAWARRQRRLDKRDAALRDLAPRHLDAKSWRIARRIADELAIYVERGSWRFDRDRGPPAHPRGAIMYRAVLLHGRRRAPSRTTIWRALAGRAV